MRNPQTMPTNYGTKLPLTQYHAKAIQEHLTRTRQWRDLALLMLGVDSLLRSCDLLKLVYDDVVDANGIVRTSLIRRQKKTKRTVECHLSAPTRRAVELWLIQSKKASGDYLFTRLRSRSDKIANTPISRNAYALRIKAWVSAVGLDPTRYSTKTLRKSRIRPILEKSGFDYQVPQILLGHTDIRSTIHYCGLAPEKALKIAAEVQFFDPLELDKLKVSLPHTNTNLTKSPK